MFIVVDGPIMTSPGSALIISAIWRVPSPMRSAASAEAAEAVPGCTWVSVM